MKDKKLTKLVAGIIGGAALLLSAPVANAASVCIDPGHGGSDPGGTYSTSYEKDVVLDTANRVKTWLDADTADSGGGSSWTVYRTRTTDVYVSLSGRASYANGLGVNRFASIHSNAFGNSSANGIETFCAPTLGTSEDFRNKIYDEATIAWPLTKRGTKTANFTVLTATNMPAELHEMAFITNTTDRGYLLSATEKDLHAKSEMFGLQRHYGVAKYTPGTSSPTIVDNTSSAFTSGSGWWTSTSTAGYYGSNYHVRGTDAVSDASTWEFNIPTTRNYKVEAWWTSGGNRAASAPYIIYNTSSGSTTVNQNQQNNGGQWNNLGTFSFTAGTREVKLSCWTTAGYYVIADAVRLSPL